MDKDCLRVILKGRGSKCQHIHLTCQMNESELVTASNSCSPVNVNEGKLGNMNAEMRWHDICQANLTKNNNVHTEGGREYGRSLSN